MTTTKIQKKNAQEVLADNLKKVKEARGLTCEQLAELLKIGKTAMVMYLKGTGNPTVETVELMAKALNVPLTALLSETWFPDKPFSESLESTIQMLHPRLKPFAVKLVDVLQELLYYSEALYDAREENSVEGIFPEQVYHYALHERQGTQRFGLLSKKKRKDSRTPVAASPSFSDDAAAVSDLARKCTQFQLSTEHLPDVVDDYIAQKQLEELIQSDLLQVGR